MFPSLTLIMKIRWTMPFSATKAIFSLLCWSYIPGFITTTTGMPRSGLPSRSAFVVLSCLILQLLGSAAFHATQFLQSIRNLQCPMGVKLKSGPLISSQTVLAPRGVVCLRSCVKDMELPNHRWVYDQLLIGKSSDDGR